MNRILSLLGLLAVLLMPTLDQLACAYCGPTPEATATVSSVPDAEGNCVLGDGFETPSRSSGGERVQIHFCVLHATDLALTPADVFPDLHPSDRLDSETGRFVGSYAVEFFHPPSVA